MTPSSPDWSRASIVPAVASWGSPFKNGQVLGRGPMRSLLLALGGARIWVASANETCGYTLRSVYGTLHSKVQDTVVWHACLPHAAYTAVLGNPCCLLPASAQTWLAEVTSKLYMHVLPQPEVLATAHDACPPPARGLSDSPCPLEALLHRKVAGGLGSLGTGDAETFTFLA